MAGYISKRISSRFWLLLGLLAVFALAVQPVTAQSLPRDQTLYIGGFQWGPPVTFNPLNPTATWPSGGNAGTGIQADGYLYETLFLYNIVNGKYGPLLAKSMEWQNSSTLIVHLQPGTMWQDGQPLTADDVAFTFNLAKDNSLSYSAFWDYVTAVKATDPQTVEFDLNPAKLNPDLVSQYVAYTYILPKHIYSDVAAKGSDALLKYVDMNPVGSGPYKVMSENAQRIVLERTDNYWGKSLYGMPAPKYVVHPIFKSNDAGNLALKQGQLDLSQEFIPSIWSIKNVHSWLDKAPYQLPGSVPMLLLNLQKPGLNNVLVRRAIAYSLDYAQIAKIAASQYSDTAQSSLILPSGAEAQYFDKENVAQYGWSYDPEKAKDILENQLHAKMGSDGIYVLPDGTKLSFTVETPYGWTDWMSALNVVSESAKRAGIDLETRFPQAPQVTSDVQSGNFEMALWYVAGVGPAGLWSRFQNMLDDRGVPPVGQTAFWDYNRFSSPEAAQLLDQAAAATTDEAKQQAFAALDKIFMQNIPGIPLMYRALVFYEYNDSVWTGWPNAQNPYAPPTFYISILRNIKAKGS